GARAKRELGQDDNDTALASHIFRLTRVTRIFQKSVFTKTTPGPPGGRPRRVFCCADASGARARRIFCCKTRRETMTFHKGESGNPAGRRRGSRNRTTTLRQSLWEAEGEALARKAIDLAKGGDLAALRMCMARLVPARKHEPIAVDLPRLDTAADTVTAASTIVAAVAAGELAPSEAPDIAQAVDTYVRALATQEFEERLAKLEGRPAPANVPAN